MFLAFEIISEYFPSHPWWRTQRHQKSFVVNVLMIFTYFSWVFRGPFSPLWPSVQSSTNWACTVSVFTFQASLEIDSQGVVGRILSHQPLTSPPPTTTNSSILCNCSAVSKPGKWYWYCVYILKREVQSWAMLLKVTLGSLRKLHGGLLEA